MKIDKSAKICFYTMSLAGGFGDLIFTLKLYNIFKEWYDYEPYIVSPTPEKFLSNGIKKSKVLHLKIPKSQQDDAHEYIENSKSIPIVDMSGETIKYEFDIIFVTPVTMDSWEKNVHHFESIFPYITSDILYRFSAYDHGGMRYEIPLGLGEDRYGIFITKPETQKRMIKNPYIMTHISNINWTESEGDYKVCLSKFIKLMVKKYYKKEPVLDIVISKSIINDFERTDKEMFDKLKEYIRKYYKKVRIIKTDNDELLEEGLNIRSDLPVLPHNKFAGLFKHALPDVLGTGNQTISDVVSCCKNFNIYYQTLPWEVNFAKNLGRILRKNYLKARVSACGRYGDKKMLEMKTDLSIIRNEYNFAKKGKGIMDKIMSQFTKKNINKDLSHVIKKSVKRLKIEN